MIMKKLHLICNAHLDPVWQWTWPEGLGAAISTFRVAADFCENPEFEGFIFNHNESLLYKWIEEYDPALFKRIQRCVELGRWHIMGGWYCQPDTGMPTGESIIRQIMTGQLYFKEKFGVSPHVAVSMDSFGHSKGLVQILQKCGYTGYMFMRPPVDKCNFPFPPTFNWQGYADSNVKVHHIDGAYNSNYTEAASNISWYMDSKKAEDTDLLKCWGIGNHGGGPSYIDLSDVTKLIKDVKDVEVLHSTPEKFIDSIDINTLPVFDKELNPVCIGCYTSMAQIKKLHRLLECNLAAAEKTSSVCEMEELLDYPVNDIAIAYEDLLFCEFHDILPGSSVKKAEDNSIQRLHHGIEITDRIINKNLFMMSQDELHPEGSDIPIIVLNPHPYEITDIFECEYMLADFNWDMNKFFSGTVYKNGTALPSQIEKEDSNMNVDWRKRISFRGTLAPLSATRFDIKLELLEKKNDPLLDLSVSPEYVFDNGSMKIAFNTTDGCVKSLIIGGKEYAGEGFGTLNVYADDEDAWHFASKTLTDKIGKFTLLNRKESAKYAGIETPELSPIQIIEDGTARTCIELLLGYENSRARIVYKLGKNDTHFDVEINVFWNEKSKLLRYSTAHCFDIAEYYGQDMYGVKELNDMSEMIAQKWVMSVDEKSNRAVSVINDSSYGLQIMENGIECTLLRAPIYTGHPIDMRPIFKYDRYHPRIDQGERSFNFTINAGDVDAVKTSTDNMAAYKNEKPVTVSYFPRGSGERRKHEFNVNGVRMDTCKKANNGKGYILRLFNNNDTVSIGNVKITALNVTWNAEFKPYEIITLKVDKGSVRRVSIINEEEI